MKPMPLPWRLAATPLALALLVVGPLSGATLAHPAQVDQVDQVDRADQAILPDALQISGTVRSQYFRALENNFAADNPGLTLQLKSQARFAAGLEGRFELRASSLAINSASGRNGNLAGKVGHAPNDVRWTEAWLTQHFAHADLRIGKQMLAWGRADGINPTDNLNARDFLTWLPFEEDQRRATWGVKYERFFDEQQQLTLFFSPRFTPGLARLPATANPIQDQQPASTWANHQLGLKWSKLGGSVDYSLSFYRGFSTQSDLHLLGKNSLGPILAQRYDAINVFGADMAGNWRRTGWRAELAYTQPRAGAWKKANWYWVAGADRSLTGNFNINVQLFGRVVQGFTDPAQMSTPFERNLALQNAISDGQLDARSYGYTLRISDKWLGETLEGEVLLITNMTRNNRMLKPMLSYALNDQWKLVTGAVLYYGPDISQFGRNKPNRRGFLELRYGF